ncbi:MAG: response regulator [Chloroflexi bacterium]|nr:response regulator [Chloroflexota bacterium]
MKKSFALIIEDDEDLGIVFSAALEEAGYEVELVQDGRTALERLSVTIPDVVVLDLHLPSVAGVDIFRDIRADKRLKNTHIVIATADLDLARVMEDRVTLTLLKPINYYQLRDLTARLLPE